METGVIQSRARRDGGTSLMMRRTMDVEGVRRRTDRLPGQAEKAGDVFDWSCVRDASLCDLARREMLETHARRTR